MAYQTDDEALRQVFAEFGEEIKGVLADELAEGKVAMTRLIWVAIKLSCG